MKNDNSDRWKKNLNGWTVQDWLDEAAAYAVKIENLKDSGEATARAEELHEMCLMGAEKLKARGRAASKAMKGVPRALRGSTAKVDNHGLVIPTPGTLRRQVYDLLLAGKTTKEICTALPIAKRRSVINMVSLFRAQLGHKVSRRALGSLPAGESDPLVTTD